MEGTPRAKARRQSLPSQHHLGPSTTQNETTTQAELLRFRDEMGIYTQAHQPAHPSFDPNLVRGQGMTVSAKAPGVRNMLRVSESMTSQQGERGRSAESTYDSGLQAKVEDSDTAYSPSGPSDPNPGGNGNLTGEDFPKKKVRKKWTLEETKMLVLGCNKHGVGNWKSMLDDRELQFDPDRTPVDLKDRFRTYFPEAYRHLYPNAKTHISNSSASRANRAELPDSLTIFEKSRSKKRRPFTKEEDDALREGFEKHGTVWALIAKHPALSSRRSTDLRDRFRNAFPDLYERAGYKPRPTKPVKRRKGEEVITSVTPQVRLQPGTSKPIASSQIRELSTVREMSMEPIENSGSPDDDDSFDATGAMTGDSGNDQPKTPQMETDPCTDTSGNFTPHKGYVHENATSMPATTSSEISVRSPGQHPQPNSSHLNPNDHLSTTQQSPAHQQQSPVHHLHPVHQQTIDDLRGLNQAWYPARWLSGTQGGYSDESTINQHTQSQQSHVSSGGGLGLNPGLPLGFGLLAGGWANQQTIIDRYDLPSSSSQFIHGGEFQSEAAIGDTGSSISGLDDYAANSQMSLSSHHRYAGDLFLARGAGYGGGGWGAWASNNFGFMLGVEPHDMPSFGRAAMDMGAPVSHSSRAASVSGASIGPHPSGLDIASATQSPEPGQMLRHDVGLDPIDGLEAVLESSILGSPHPMDPTKTLVHEVATPPPGTPAPNSPPSRSFSSLDMYGNPVVGPVPGMGLMRHASMGSVDTLGHGSQMTKRSENQHHQHQHQPQHQQQQSGHHSVHATHQHPGVSHSRSFSQPPSDHRIQPATGRPANTTAPSPVKAPFQHLDSRPYTSAMEALTSSVPPSSPAHRSIGVSQNDHTNSGGTSGQRSQNLHAHSESSVHIQGSHSGEQALSQQQQQRTPVQKHAILQPSTSLYQPASSTSQFNPSGAPWGQLSTAAVALDLHGYQMYQASHIYSQPLQQTASVQSLTLAGPSTGPGPYGSHVMDQYLDFETHALDLATAAGSLPVNSTISPTWATTLSPPESQPPFTPTSRHQISSNSNAYNRGQNVTSDFLTQKNAFRTPEISTTAPTSQLQNAQGHHLFGYSTPGISSMDDSMIITTPPNHGSLGGIMRRESFSYGTTPHTQATASGLMVPLNRVQSADRAVVSPNTQASQAQGASRPRGWDQTVTGRNAKRSSWGAMRSLANAT